MPKTEAKETGVDLNVLLDRIKTLEDELEEEKRRRKSKENSESEEEKAIKAEIERRNAEDEELVEVRLPRTTAGDTEVFLSINGKAIRIKRGETVSIARKYVKLLADMEAAQNNAFEIIEKNSV